MKIIVLAGGLSDERDVSLSSGSLVANALIENAHQVELIDLYTGLEKMDNLFKTNKKYEYNVSDKNPNLYELIKLNNGRTNQVGPNIINACKKADIVFNALHGGIGENGKLQALFDIHNIKYTGTSYLGSAISMDKSLSKELMLHNKIATPKGITYKVGQTNLNEINLKYPLVIKPSNNGSSIGVYMVNNEDELKKAINSAKEYDRELIIEEFIKGREFSVGVLKDIVLPAIEIIPNTGFYDYKNKYQAGLTTEICPANITYKQETILKKAALKTFDALKLDSYTRIDFILDENNIPYCLEANTLPGMTPTSLLPQEAKACGINYNELCEKIIELAFNK